MKNSYRINIAAPNIVNVCIDRRHEGENMGRMYCCYSEYALFFKNEMHLIKMMDGFMDTIGYPQSSVTMRSYHEVKHEKQYPRKLQEPEKFAGERGVLDTFLIQVQYRQRATWQGRVYWVEGKKYWDFRSALELLKLMDSTQNFFIRGVLSM